jgi:Protein of unknown function (DUF2971)
MPPYLYRYRSAAAVLSEFHELEKQEIYFSPPGDLNDPMEGFKDLFWQGDEVVWRNLLRHYALCLLETSTTALIAGEKFDGEILNSIVFAAPHHLPMAPIRDIYHRVSTAFLDEPAVKDLVEALARRQEPVRRNELTSYLRSLQPLALGIVFKEFQENGVLPSSTSLQSCDSEILRQNITKVLNALAQLPKTEPSFEKAADAIFAATEAAADQLDLLLAYENKDKPAAIPMSFLTGRFPAAYAKALDRLVHRDTYFACFSANAANPSMWATYGNGHRGVCLKFKASHDEPGKPTISLKQIVGASATKDRQQLNWGHVPHPLYKMEYTANYPPIDFFRSLGNTSEMNLSRFWFKGDDGEASPCRDAIFRDQASWRDGYWKTALASSLCKTAEWAHEEEYRAILSSGFDLREKSSRKLQYEFEELAGIVFGFRTKHEHKLEIMEIIDRKCSEAGRSDFEFSEVRYSAVESKFHVAPLTLLKVKPT